MLFGRDIEHDAVRVAVFALMLGPLPHILDLAVIAAAGLLERRERVHHVIDQHATLTLDLTDHIHHLRLVGPGPPFIDDGQIRIIESLRKCARTHDAADPTDLFQCNSSPFARAEPGVWYTMSIPINEWRRNDEARGGGFVGPPPKSGETVYMMSWSSRKVRRGLVIDRVWVTRGGAGKIEMKPWEDEGESNAR